jgi:hypothetical protein
MSELLPPEHRYANNERELNEDGSELSILLGPTHPATRNLSKHFVDGWGNVF